MNAGALARLVMTDFRRQLGVLAGAACGVVVAIAGLAFIMALVLGVRAVLVGEVFPVDRVEVAPATRDLDLLALRFSLGADTLTDDQVSELARLAGVAAVYPKMKVTVPALATGGESVLGTDLQTELVADGIDPGLVAAEVGDAFAWSELDPPVRCALDGDCPTDSYCGDGAAGASLCRRYVPVLLSNHLLELYNGSFRRAYGLPRLNPEFALGLRFEMAFGASTLSGSARRQVVRERMRVAGFSDAAIPLGVTLPLSFVRRLNASSGSASAVDEYHSAVVIVADRAALPRVLEAVKAMGLVVKDRGAEQAATLMAVVLALAALVGGTMVVVAAMSVAQAFFMLVFGRQREIGVLRAVGARRTDVTSVILAEAAVLGAASGAIGVTLALAAAAAADRLAASRLPDFPYRPETFFSFPWWLLAGSVGLAIIACLAGALHPARRAAARDPAETLSAP